MEETKKRTRTTKTTEEKITELEAKIAYHTEAINALRAKIDELNTPKMTMKDVTAKAKECGISADELMKLVDKLAAKK